jgi:hypothetical protein
MLIDVPTFSVRTQKFHPLSPLRKEGIEVLVYDVIVNKLPSPRPNIFRK